jgi:primary-amine oxidase
MTRSLVGTAIGTTVVLLLVTFAIGPAAAHPMDPLTADEIIQAASILLDGGAAQPGTIFQAIDLREPARSEVVGLAPGDGLPRRAPFEVAP